jgi:hypothetical protein
MNSAVFVLPPGSTRSVFFRQGIIMAAVFFNGSSVWREFTLNKNNLK